VEVADPLCPRKAAQALMKAINIHSKTAMPLRFPLKYDFPCLQDKSRTWRQTMPK